MIPTPDGLTEPRQFAELAGHARDVQAKAHDIEIQAKATMGITTQALAWEVQRLAAQLAEVCERLAPDGTD